MEIRILGTEKEIAALLRDVEVQLGPQSNNAGHRQPISVNLGNGKQGTIYPQDGSSIFL